MFACNEQYFNQIFVFESTSKTNFSSKRSEYYSNLKHTKASDFSLNHHQQQIPVKNIPPSPLPSLPFAIQNYIIYGIVIYATNKTYAYKYYCIYNVHACPCVTVQSHISQNMCMVLWGNALRNFSWEIGYRLPTGFRTSIFDVSKSFCILLLFFSHSVVSASFVTPQTIACQDALAWDSLGKKSRVSCHVLLRTQGSNPGLLHCRWILYHQHHPGSPGLIISSDNPAPRYLLKRNGNMPPQRLLHKCSQQLYL